MTENYPFLRDLRSPVKGDQLQPLDPRCRRLQFNSDLSQEDHKQVAQFLSAYPAVQLRDYRFDGNNVDYLRHYAFLKSYSIDAFHLKNWDGLQFLPMDLETLGLGQTRTKALSLHILRRFPKLSTLYVTGHHKGFEVLGELDKLDTLYLNNISVIGLDPLSNLRSLKTLSINLGGIKNLEAIRDLEIENLELFRVAGLANLDFIAFMKKLRKLVLMELSRVERLPSFAGLDSLQRLLLEKMARLESISCILEASALREIFISKVPRVGDEELLGLAKIATLEKVTVITNSRKWDRVIALALNKLDASYLDLRS